MPVFVKFYGSLMAHGYGSETSRVGTARFNRGITAVMYRGFQTVKNPDIFVIGPTGFQMCSCLQVLRRRLPSRHTVAALVTELKRADEFKGESIHLRWQSSIQPWPIEGVDSVTSTVMSAVRTRGGSLGT